MRQNQPALIPPAAQPVVGIIPQSDDEPDVSTYGIVVPARLSLSLFPAL
jgi:hypothetical protein